jgi:hypothetical protein
MSRHPNSGQNQNIRTANESFENAAKFKYLGTMLTNQNDIHDEINIRITSVNACYHSVQNFLSSLLISKNLKIKIYKTVILSVVLYGCETWRMRWAGHVARMGEGRGEVFTGLWLVGPKARDHWENLGVGGRITLKWTLGRQGSMRRAGFSWLRIGSSGGLV